MSKIREELILSALEKERNYSLEQDRINFSLLSMIAAKTSLLPSESVLNFLEGLDKDRIANVFNKLKASHATIDAKRTVKTKTSNFDFMFKAFGALKKLFTKKAIEKAKQKS